jgi:MOSC domain-containing protein YiiM
VRPGHYRPATGVAKAEALTERGLSGDHYAADGEGKRQVTLIQFEHFPVIAKLCGLEQVAPELLRRNLVVSGINLLALRDTTFYVGSVLLQGSGCCHPCSRMEKTLGAGGYHAVRGHGGITARVLQGGSIRVGDPVYVSRS